VVAEMSNSTLDLSTLPQELRSLPPHVLKVIVGRFMQDLSDFVTRPPHSLCDFANSGHIAKQGSASGKIVDKARGTASQGETRKSFPTNIRGVCWRSCTHTRGPASQQNLYFVPPARLYVSASAFQTWWLADLKYSRALHSYILQLFANFAGFQAARLASTASCVTRALSSSATWTLSSYDLSSWLTSASVRLVQRLCDCS